RIGAWGVSPKSLTKIINVMTSPRRASTETTRGSPVLGWDLVSSMGIGVYGKGMHEAGCAARPGVESRYRIRGPLGNKVWTDWVRSLVNPPPAGNSLRSLSGSGRQDGPADAKARFRLGNRVDLNEVRSSQAVRVHFSCWRKVITILASGSYFRTGILQAWVCAVVQSP